MPIAEPVKEAIPEPKPVDIKGLLLFSFINLFLYKIYVQSV